MTINNHRHHVTSKFWNLDVVSVHLFHSILSPMTPRVGNLFQDSDVWPAGRSLYYLGVLPQFFPRTIHSPQVHTRLSHECHTVSIRLAAQSLRFGLPPAVHRFLSHTVLLLLLSLYLPILLEFFLLPLLIILSLFLFLSPLLLSCSFSCTFCSFLLLFSGPSGTRTYYLSPTHRPLFAYSLVVFVWKPRSTAVDPGVIY